ncbi:hypothetical protein P9112_003921 [Eukaryota sp. TZLM1-RC]
MDVDEQYALLPPPQPMDILSNAINILQDFKPSVSVSQLLRTTDLEKFKEAISLHHKLPSTMHQSWTAVVKNPINNTEDLIAALKVFASRTAEMGFDVEGFNLEDTTFSVILVADLEEFRSRSTKKTFNSILEAASGYWQQFTLRLWYIFFKLQISSSDLDFVALDVYVNTDEIYEYEYDESDEEEEEHLFIGTVRASRRIFDEVVVPFMQPLEQSWLEKPDPNTGPEEMKLFYANVEVLSDYCKQFPYYYFIKPVELSDSDSSDSDSEMEFGFGDQYLDHFDGFDGFDDDFGNHQVYHNGEVYDYQFPDSDDDTYFGHPYSKHDFRNLMLQQLSISAAADRSGVKSGSQVPKRRAVPKVKKGKVAPPPKPAKPKPVIPKKKPTPSKPPKRNTRKRK